MNDTHGHKSCCRQEDETYGAGQKPKDQILEAGAAMVQNFAPVQQICAHLNAFHVYASDTSRIVEANHYCTHLDSGVRQCLIYDGPGKGARLIGVEYMISREAYNKLPHEERILWHSHDFEVCPSAGMQGVWGERAVR